MVIYCLRSSLKFSVLQGNAVSVALIQVQKCSHNQSQNDGQYDCGYDDTWKSRVGKTQHTMITIYYKSSTLFFGSRVGRRGGYGKRCHYYVSTASNNLE